MHHSKKVELSFMKNIIVEIDSSPTLGKGPTILVVLYLLAQSIRIYLIQFLVTFYLLGRELLSRKATVPACPIAIDHPSVLKEVHFFNNADLLISGLSPYLTLNHPRSVDVVVYDLAVK